MKMEQLNHIEIAREDSVKKYRFHSNPNAGGVPDRNRFSHGQKLENEINETTHTINAQRQLLGIEPDKLLIISIINQSLSEEQLSRMLKVFNLSLVEEVDIEGNKSRLLIQFPDKNSVDSFNHERHLWETDSHEEGVLSYAQRRDIFQSIDAIRGIGREDRIGPRLRRKTQNNEPLPDGFFYVDVDIWYNGDRRQVIEVERNIKRLLGTEGSTIIGDVLETSSLLLGRARVNQFSLETLLKSDFIASVDLPMGTASEECCELLTTDINPVLENHLDGNAPCATIIDSGIFSAHPLLQNTILAEEDFDQIEDSTTDMCGHGTGVAGIVVYGDFYSSVESRVFKPLVRICNAKVMHRDDYNRPTFKEDERPESIVKKAIEHFHREYDCRIFNLSAGNPDAIYNLGRQLPWAEVLDQLSRELDIVIIVSAGNVSSPEIPDFTNRTEFMEKCRNGLFTHDHRLIDPATASLCITVGSVARFDEPEMVANRSVRLPCSPKDMPSVFTRIGRGVNKAIKPEFVHYGGNYSFHQISRGNSRWIMEDRKLAEVSLSYDGINNFRSFCGTSFAAPHITHIAARVERSLEEQLGTPPSANLLRAVLANSASVSESMVQWAEDSVDRNYGGSDNPKQERRLRLLGYGKIDNAFYFSGKNHVTLFSEDRLNLRNYHLYKIPVPEDFIRLSCEKRISISMAYNPITRLSRKDYLANHLWFETYRRIDETALEKYKARREAGDESASVKLPDTYKASFHPGYTEIRNSTLQQRIWEKTSRGGRDLLWDGQENPYFYILITGKENFKYSGIEEPQPYAVVVTFSYNGEEDIHLYNTIHQNVRLRSRAEVRTRAQIRG